MLGNHLKMFDGYNRVARIYPALITLTPLVWYVALFSTASSMTVIKGGIALLALGCLLYLLGTVARWRGKTVEPLLLFQWGGWPTTVLLRHRDGAIDQITKERYHAALYKITGVRLPDADEENRAPEAGDDAYRSATKVLIESRRGPEYQMLDDENASYGFRRNLYGLRPIAIGLGVLLSLFTCGVWWFINADQMAASTFWHTLRAQPAWPAVILLNVCYIAFFAVVVTPTFVLQAAREYAHALFRTLDAAAKGRRRGPR